jgi:small-conductance mechanosensitive channel
VRILKRASQLFVAFLLLGLFIGTFVARGQQTPAQRNPAEPAEKDGVPVVVNGETLFQVHARLFQFSPEDRAKAIAQKVAWLSKQPPSRIQAIIVTDEGNVTEIVSEDTVLMTVTEADANIAGQARQALAQQLADRIRTAAQALHRDISLKTILLAAFYTLLATVVLVLVLKLLGIGFRRLYAKLRSWHGVYIRSIRIQKLELLPAERILQLLNLVARALRAGLSLVLLYAYLTVVLNFFPWTRGYASILLQYTLSPLQTVWRAITAYLPNVFFIAVILTVAYYVVKFAKFVFREIGKGTITFPGFYPEWAEPTYNIARFLILAFTAVVVFPYLPGSRSPAFQGVSIFLGLLISLGSTSAVANVVAGSVLTYTRAFQVGDRVKIGDAVGDVTEKTLLVTRIRTIKNVNIAIPNAMVLNSHIINFSTLDGEQSLILHTRVSIGYDAPWRKVHELLIAAAISTEDILKDPKPFVFQTSLDDFYVSYELNAFTGKPNQMARIYSDLHQNIQDKFNEGGVEIMSPHYGSVRDGNSMAIPAEYLPKSYEAPPFRVLPVVGWPSGKPKSTSSD